MAPWIENIGIDEVRKPPETQPDRRNRAGQIAQRQERNAAPLREADHGDDAAEEAAVERHPAVPDLDDLARVRDEMRQVVEQHVPQPAADQPDLLRRIHVWTGNPRRDVLHDDGCRSATRDHADRHRRHLREPRRVGDADDRQDVMGRVLR